MSFPPPPSTVSTEPFVPAYTGPGSVPQSTTSLGTVFPTMSSRASSLTAPKGPITWQKPLQAAVEEHTVSEADLKAVDGWIRVDGFQAIYDLTTIMKEQVKQSKKAEESLETICQNLELCLDAFPRNPVSLRGCPTKESVSGLADVLHAAVTCGMYDMADGLTTKKHNFLASIESSVYKTPGPSAKIQKNKNEVRRAFGTLTDLLRSSESLWLALRTVLRAKGHIIPDRPFGGSWAARPSASSSALSTQVPTTDNESFEAGAGFTAHSSRQETEEPPIQQEELPAYADPDFEWEYIQSALIQINNAVDAIVNNMPGDVRANRQEESIRRTVLEALKICTVELSPRPSVNELIPLIKAFFHDFENAEIHQGADRNIVLCLTWSIPQEDALKLWADLLDSILSLRPSLGRRLQDMIFPQLVAIDN